MENVLSALSYRIIVVMAKKALQSSELLAALFALRHAGIGADSMINLNDYSMAFNEIADYLDQIYELANSKN